MKRIKYLISGILTELGFAFVILSIAFIISLLIQHFR